MTVKDTARNDASTDFPCDIMLSDEYIPSTLWSLLTLHNLGSLSKHLYLSKKKTLIACFSHEKGKIFRHNILLQTTSVKNAFNETFIFVMNESFHILFRQL